MNAPTNRRRTAGRMQKMIRLVLPVLALVVLAALMSPWHRAEAASVTVQVGQRPGGSSGSQFNSASVTVNSGDSVTFARFAGTHDVQSAVVPGGAAQFSSPSPLSAASPFAVTLSVPGVYTYFCTIHSDATEATASGIDASIASGNMVGKIVVTTAATPTATTAAATATPVPPTVTAVGPTATPGVATPTPAATATAGPTSTPTVATTPGSTPTTAPTTTPVVTATPVPAGPGGVNIVDFSFTPTGITVAAGTSVRWVNIGAKKHTVTADDSSFDSGLLATGDTFTRTFATAGTFTYYCDVHPEMTGTVTVAGSSGSSPTPAATSSAATPTATATTSAPPPVSVPGTVQIVDFSFAPATMRVTMGSTVRWENAGSKKHTATANDGSFDSGLMAKGDAFSHTFSRAGAFRYECDLHPEMTGEIQVIEAAASGTAGELWPTPSGIPVSLIFNEGWDPIQRQWIATTAPSLAQITTGNSTLWALILSQVRAGSLFARDLPPNIVAFVESQYARLGGPPASFYTAAPVAPGTPASPSSPAATPAPAVPVGPGAVQVVDYDFSPRVVTVATGSTVRFTNAGKARHTVTSNTNDFDSGLLVGGDSYSFTFAAAGTYEYFCIVHPDMTGTVAVVGASGTAPSAPSPSAGAAVPAPMPIVPGDVQVVDFDYSPRTVTVVAGASVRFTNTGVAPHTVTARDGTFDSGFLGRGDAFRHVFASAGTYQFFCDFHPQMAGTVVVLTATGGAVPASAEAVPAATTGLPNFAALLGPKTGANGEKALTASIVDFAYQPGALSVARGTTVTWTNDGAAPHTVTTRDGAHDSGILKKGATYAITFDTNGTFEYYCTIHPDMKATVTVADGASAEAPAKPAPAAAGFAESVTSSSSHHSLALILALAIAGFAVIVVVGVFAAIGASETK